MLVTVYEMARGETRQRQVSLDMTVDYAYWFLYMTDAKVDELRVCSERMSVQDALTWRDEGSELRIGSRKRRDRQSMTDRITDKTGSEKTAEVTVWWTVRKEAWLQQFADQLNERLVAYKLNGGTSRSWAIFGIQAHEDQLRLAAGKLAGRRLLLEEVRRLCMDAGLLDERNDGDIYKIVQLLLLSGNVRLDRGMYLDTSFAAQSLEWFGRGRDRRGNHKRKNLCCGRCNSGPDKHYSTDCAVCGRECIYCEACLQMGRVRECSIFVVGVGTQEAVEQEVQEMHALDVGSRSFRLSANSIVAGIRSMLAGRTKRSRLSLLRSLIWAEGCREESEPEDKANESMDSERLDKGEKDEDRETDQLLRRWKLSPAQKEASREALMFIKEPSVGEGEQYLIWAVTGAGKTEMVYPLVEYVLQKGGRVLLTAPRRDVVLELAPRLAKAFAESEVIALYGGSEHRWEIGDITVATTHQLLRLERCFDLVVLDELDAYPYHNNPMLAFATRRACKSRGKTVLLTATPPREQQLAMRQRRLPHAMVPVRFHRHPLPEPRILRYRGLVHTLGAGRLPSDLRAALEASLHRGAQVFVFVPRIEHVEPLTRLLRKACADAVDAAAVDGTSSRDADRAERVRRFRSGEIRLLVTTTILERGVTIPRSDVFVLDADAALFDEAALVQMAGRAGRSADDPCGRVYYVARERTDGIRQAVHQIRAMNRLARQRGLLLGSAARRKEESDA